MAEKRDASIDHIRIVLTVLVILHHVAIVYGGSGGWYWREQPNASNSALLMFNAINQAFFMGFFFLLAGYYTPSSLARKGVKQFMVDRVLRLGVPLAIYFFILNPLTRALARTGTDFAFLSGWYTLTASREFGPGPLWFAQALFLFTGGYVLWRKLRPANDETAVLPRVSGLTLAAFALGVSSFLVRLVVPVGKEVAWMQLGYFPCYIYLFFAGCAASRSRVLDGISWRDARPWIFVSLLTILTLPAVRFLNLGQGSFEGGWTSHALYYALWDPFVAWGIILGMLWVARTYWSRATPLSVWLAGSTYGAFIVHPPVVVGVSRLVATWTLGPGGKFMIVGLAASMASFLIAAMLLELPGARRIL